MFIFFTPCRKVDVPVETARGAEKHFETDKGSVWTSSTYGADTQIIANLRNKGRVLGVEFFVVLSVKTHCDDRRGKELIL
jgi:hypothetical protein